MSDPEGAGRVCPFLGLPDDPHSHYSFAELVHRCWSKERPHPIELAYQASVCLGGTYEACPRFRLAERAIPAWHPAAQTFASAAVTRPRKDRRRGVRRGIAPAARIGAVIALVGLLLLAAVIYLPGIIGPGPGVGLLPTDTPSPPPATPTVEPKSEPTPIPPPSAIPSPTLAPTPSPTVRPTPLPTPTPFVQPTPTPIIHIVERGETLSSIAADYGVRPREIAELNELENANRIYIGQELLIPVS